MNAFAACWRTLSLLALVAVLFTGAPSIAWAQDEDEEEEHEEEEQGYGGGYETGAWAGLKKEEDKPPPYVLPYFVVILSLGAGMRLVCRSSRRRSLKRAAWLPSGATEKQRAAEGGPAPRTKQFCEEAKTGLNMAIAGIIPFVGILGLLKSIQARKMISQNPRLTGEGQALAGIIIGAATVVAWVIVIVIVLIKVLSSGGGG